MDRYAASDAAALATQALEAAERAADAEVSARALVLRGRAHHATGDDAAALADLTKGADEARAAGDRRLEMLALYEVGTDIPVQRGLPVGYYTSNLENGLRIAESLGDRAIEANMLSRLAVIATNRLCLDAALERGLRAVAAGRMAADDHALASGLDALKNAYLSLGDVSALTGVLAELIPMLRRLRDPFLLQWAEFENAFPAIAAADWTSAAAAMQSAMEINRTAGYPHCAVWYVAHQGWLARLRGHREEAIMLGHQAVELTEQHEATWWQATACAMLGDTVLLAGDRAGAIALFERGLAAARQAGVEAYLLRCAAPLAAATGSRALLAEAAGLLEQASIPDGGAWVPGYEAYLSLAEAWLAHDEPDRARAVLAPLLAVAEREPWIPILAAALAADGRALARLARGEQERAERGRAEVARAELDRAIRLAGQHGLPNVLREARKARRQLG